MVFFELTLLCVIGPKDIHILTPEMNRPFTLQAEGIM